MTDKRITSLLQQYANDTISRDDFQVLVQYFKLSGHEDEILAAMDEIWEKLNKEDHAGVEHVKNAVYARLVSQTRSKPAFKLKQITPWYRYAAAALLLLAGVAGFYLFKSTKPDSLAVRFKNDVKPGFDQATLTLADGRVINLGKAGNSALIQEQGVSIKKTANGLLSYDYQVSPASSNTDTSKNTIRTPKGGQYQVMLSDGSHVWLNTASSLTFPVKFHAADRTVKLTGEAYFEVAKNAKRPFRVIAGNQQIQVLGTHFDVNAYDDEPANSTTLLEGKVHVITPVHSVTLKPGQQSVFANNHLDIQSADLEEIMAWKNGLFLYNQQSLETIMRQVSRWYNVEVVFEDKSLKNQLFSGALSRFRNISELLEVLETTGSVHFKIEGRRVTAMQ